MKKFKCIHCNSVREVSLIGEIMHPHWFGKKLFMKCHKCDHYCWHVKEVNNGN